jgi:hypothetical protein
VVFWCAFDVRRCVRGELLGGFHAFTGRAWPKKFQNCDQIVAKVTKVSTLPLPHVMVTIWEIGSPSSSTHVTWPNLWKPLGDPVTTVTTCTIIRTKVLDLALTHQSVPPSMLLSGWESSVPASSRWRRMDYGSFVISAQMENSKYVQRIEVQTATGFPII